MSAPEILFKPRSFGGYAANAPDHNALGHRLPHAYALFALTKIGRESKDFCGGWNN